MVDSSQIIAWLESIAEPGKSAMADRPAGFTPLPAARQPEASLAAKKSGVHRVYELKVPYQHHATPTLAGACRWPDRRLLRCWSG